MCFSAHSPNTIARKTLLSLLHLISSHRLQSYCILSCFLPYIVPRTPIASTVFFPINTLKSPCYRPLLADDTVLVISNKRQKWWQKPMFMNLLQDNNYLVVDTCELLQNKRWDKKFVMPKSKIQIGCYSGIFKINWPSNQKGRELSSVLSEGSMLNQQPFRLHLYFQTFASQRPKMTCKGYQKNELQCKQNMNINKKHMHLLNITVTPQWRKWVPCGAHNQPQCLRPKCRKENTISNAIGVLDPKKDVCSG